MSGEASDARGCRESWCCKNISFYYNDHRVFLYSPWLPYTRRYQALYLVYRWTLTCYFMFWLLWSVAHETSAKYLTYMTNWAFVTFNLYLLVGAMSVSTAFTGTHCHRKQLEEDGVQELVNTTHLPQSCGRSQNKTRWYHMIQWLLFILGGEMSFLVFIYYWLLVYEGEPINGAGINAHLLSGIFAIADLWLSGIPVKLLHALYPIIYGAVYIVFTGVYHAITGKNIYNSLDYKDKPWTSVLAVTAVIIAVPFFHVVMFYCQYKVKQDILQCFRNKQWRRKRRRRAMIPSVSYSNDEVTLE